MIDLQSELWLIRVSFSAVPTNVAIPSVVYVNLTLEYTVKPVYSDHLYGKIYCQWFIQYRVLMKTEGTNLLLLTISACWSSSRWPLAT